MLYTIEYSRIGGFMFNENWYLFLLIILLLFTGPDGIDRTESFVLIGIVAGLLLSGDFCPEPRC